jgi:N-acylglucosamine 2-epimerase
MKSNFLTQSKKLYQDTLVNNLIPFWLRHGLDRTNGGLSNIMEDDGTILSHEKYLWSQGRALWTFAALYNRIEQRKEWLEAAHYLYRYLSTQGRDDQGRWMYRLDENGNVLEKDTSIYVDGFVMNGMGEYYKATGNRDALDIAVATFQNTWQRINTPGSYRVMPYILSPGTKTHGVAMVFSFFYFNLGVIADCPDIRQAGLRLAGEIMDHFYVPEKDAVLEFVSLDGKFIDSPEGRACVPGHALEALWFLITIFEQTGETARIKQCCRLIKRHLELGWDSQYGGLRLALDIDHKEPVFWKHPECKPWWVQVEALVATLYAYHHTRNDLFLEWHKNIQDFAFSHYPVPTGEWTQWLDQQGNKMPNPVLPVKDPFHLPRGLMYMIEVLGRR